MAPSIRPQATSFVAVLFVALTFASLTPALGQVSFLQTPTYTSAAVAAADFNQDGKLDLLGKDGTVFLGKGDGTFQTGTKLTNSPSFVADFNNDGKPDVLVLTSDFHLFVYMGNGDGTFQAPVDTYAALALTDVAVADVNRDNQADVLVLDPLAGLLVFLSKGDGTFAAPVSYLIPANSPIFIGDFNGDGKPDVLATGVNTISVLFGNGDGTFQAAKTSSTSGLAQVVAIGNLNGDSKLDLLVSTSFTSAQFGTMFGNGDGTFQAPNNQFALNFVGTPFLADVNDDGKLDLLIESYPFAQICLGNGDGTFAPAHNYSANSVNLDDTTSPLFGDFNNDGKIDIATFQSVLLGNGDGTFRASQALFGPNFGFPLAVNGDFNKDGKSDIAVASTSGDVYVYLSDGSGSLNLTHTYALSAIQELESGDFNGDGKIDLLASVPSGGAYDLTVLFGNGDGSFGTPVQSSSCQTPVDLSHLTVVADLNDDGKADIVSTYGNVLAICISNGDGSFASPVSYVSGANSNGVVVADFNNDGRLDAVVSSEAGLAIFFGNGDGTFQGAHYVLTTSSSVEAAADFNQDGNIDLIVNGTVYLGNGQGAFLPLTKTTELTGIPVDINGDGNIDLVADNYSVQGIPNFPELAIFLGNGDGTFQAPIVLDTWESDLLSSAFMLVGDFNGDHRPDLAVNWVVMGGHQISNSGIQTLLNTTLPTPGVHFSPTAITFPKQTIGTSSGTASVALSNTGKAALTVTSISISGLNASEFTQTNNCSTVQSGASCIIEVTFSPTSGGNATASLSVADNAIGSPQAIVLSGTATSLGLIVKSNSASIAAGSSATYALSIGGAGWSGPVALTCIGAPKGAACSVLPANVIVSATSNSSLAVTVTTTSRTSAALIPMQFHSSLWLWAVALMGFVILPASARKHSSTRHCSVLKCIQALPLALILLLPACGGGGGSSTNPQPNPNGTPAGTYTLTVTATPTSGTSQSVPLMLTVQ